MRQISNDCLKEYVTGAVYFKEDDDGLIPYRFSEEKLVSTKGNLRREIRHYGAAGIRIDFFLIQRSCISDSLLILDFPVKPKTMTKQR